MIKSACDTCIRNDSNFERDLAVSKPEKPRHTHTINTELKT